MFKRGRFIHLDYLYQNRQNVMFSPKTTDQSVTSARSSAEQPIMTKQLIISCRFKLLFIFLSSRGQQRGLCWKALSNEPFLNKSFTKHHKTNTQNTGKPKHDAWVRTEENWDNIRTQRWVGRVEGIIYDSTIQTGGNTRRGSVNRKERRDTRMRHRTGNLGWE